MAPDPDSDVAGIEHLTPTKNTLTALKSDVTLESAVKELVDNALDGWKRNSDRQDHLSVEIFTKDHGERTEMVIRDNSGGVPRDEAAMLFGLGRTAKSRVPGSIGTYGLGAKKALVNLGVPFTIASRHRDAGVGWQYSIDEAWFEDDEDWSVSVEEEENLSQGITEIRIHDLDYNWSEETKQGLKDDLGVTYNLFLDDTLDRESYDVEITVEGDTVEPAGLPDFSYTPFDGMHPRRFENIQIETEDMDEPVEMHITVGLLRKKNPQAAGTDIYCQKRKVVSARRDKVGGFGKGRDHLGPFTVHKERLKILVELETDGDGQQLPWDTQKSAIDPHNEVMEGKNKVYNWIRRTAQHYYDLDANRVAEAFLEPYDFENKHAKGSIPQRFKYENRTNVVGKHKPDKNIPEVSDLLDIVHAHATLGFRCTRDLESEFIDAYRRQMERESDIEYEDLPELNVSPRGLDPADAEIELERIEKLAQKHADAGIRYPDELERWQVFAYERTLDEETPEGKELVHEEPPDDIPSTTAEIAEEEQDPEGKLVIGGTEEPEGEVASDEETVNLTLQMFEEGESREGLVLAESREELCRKLGLPEDADFNRIAEQLNRRVELVLQMGAPAQ